MSGTLRLRGATSGYSELQAPAVAADQTFVLPTAGGTLLTTDSPVPKLTLELGSASQPSLTFEGDTDTGLYSSGTNTLNLVTGGSNRLNIDSSGQVGINTTSPTKLLDVNGTFRVVNESTFDADVTVYGNAQLNQQGVKLQSGLITAVQAIGSNSVFRGLTTAGGDYKIDLKASGDAVFLGAVGIGTSSPDYHLTIGDGSSYVIQNLKAASNEFCEFRFGDTASVAQGKITYDNGSDSLRFSANVDERMRIDSSGNVGIGGTPASNEQLLVRQSAVTNAPSRAATLYLESNGNCEIQFVGNSSNDCQLRFGTSNNSFKGALEYQLDNNALLAYVNGSEAMRIDSSGNVGIGVSSPTSTLQVYDTTARNSSYFASPLRIGNKGTNTNGGHLEGEGPAINFSLQRSADGVAANTAYIRAVAEGDLGSSWPTALTFACQRFGSSPVEFMRLDSAGNVGIGTTSPAAGLDIQVNANPVLSIDRGTANTANFKLKYNGTDTGALSAGNADFQISAIGASTPISFYTNGNLRTTIDSSGNVGIGVSPSARLTVKSPGANQTFISGKNSSNTEIYKVVQNTGGGSELYLNGADGSNTVLFSGSTGSATFAGTVKIGGTAAANTIDEYEEGTWTPAAYSNFNGMSNAEGYYVKVGNVVTVNYQFNYTSLTNSSNSSVMSGLPFSAADHSSSTGVEATNVFFGSHKYGIVYANSSTLVFESNTPFIGSASTGADMFRGTMTYLT